MNRDNSNNSIVDRKSLNLNLSSHALNNNQTSSLDTNIKEVKKHQFKSVTPTRRKKIEINSIQENELLYDTIDEVEKKKTVIF